MVMPVGVMIFLLCSSDLPMPELFCPPSGGDVAVAK